MSPFACDPQTLDQAFGFLLSFSLSNFSFAGFFRYLRSAESREEQLAEFEHRPAVIHIPQAILAIVHLLDNIPETDEILPYSVFKVVERLVTFSHRNQASLSALGLGGILFDRLYCPSPSHAISPQTELVMQKLLKKLLSIGASTKDAREMFRKVVQEDGIIDSHILETLRLSMRVKWPEHFTFDGEASIELPEDVGKGMPCSQGFSFMVRALSCLRH